MSESAFSFRLRFNRCTHSTVNIDRPDLVLAEPSTEQRVVLTSPDRKTPIKESLTLVLRSDGWPSEKSAQENGQIYSNALRRALAKTLVGANYGEFGPKGFLTKYGEAILGKQIGRRVLNDIHGLMVFESEPAPVFGQTSVSPLIGRSETRFLEAFDAAVSYACHLDDRERLAFEFFNGSFFQEAANPKFMLLVMAIEALLTQERYRAEIREHIDCLIELTQDSKQLIEAEKAVLLGSIGRLKKKSVKQAGRRFCAERLGEREYDGQSASDFFANSYDIRSAMAHGSVDQDTYDKVQDIVGTLEQFVSDVLSAPLERQP